MKIRLRYTSVLERTLTLGQGPLEGAHTVDEAVAREAKAFIRHPELYVGFDADRSVIAVNTEEYEREQRWIAEVWDLVWGPPGKRLPETASLSEARDIASQRTGHWPRKTL